MTNKVIVSKEIAEALSSLDSNWSKAEIIERTAIKGWIGHNRQVLNSTKLETVINALMYGYEAEQPKVLKIDDFLAGSKEIMNARLIKKLDEYENAPTCSYEDGIYDGIRLALSILHIGITK